MKSYLSLLLHPMWFYSLIAILGVCVGSFLNVVIYRLPLCLKQAWRLEAYDCLDMPAPKAEHKKFNLSEPPSHCPRCQHAVRWYDNVPLLSYLWLKGKCRHCRHSISCQYPLVEFATLVLSLFVAYHYQTHVQFLIPVLVLTWALLALFVIDMQHQLLPDQITQPLLWLGLFLNAQQTLFVDISSAITGAIVAYVSLWIIAWVFQRVTSKEGMGHGDFKLFAVFGAWLGWIYLPFIILGASILGLVMALMIALFRRHQLFQPMPFGPCLAISGWLMVLYGQYFFTWYWQWIVAA